MGDHCERPNPGRNWGVTFPLIFHILGHRERGGGRTTKPPHLQACFSRCREKGRGRWRWVTSWLCERGACVAGRKGGEGQAHTFRSSSLKCSSKRGCAMISSTLGRSSGLNLSIRSSSSTTLPGTSAPFGLCSSLLRSFAGTSISWSMMYPRGSEELILSSFSRGGVPGEVRAKTHSPEGLKSPPQPPPPPLAPLDRSWSWSL